MRKAPSRRERVQWLRCAADYINAFGLTKRRMWRWSPSPSSWPPQRRPVKPPPACTAGALHMTRQFDAEVFEAGCDINAVLRSWGVMGDFVCFNDAPHTSKSNVVRLLLETAQRLEEGSL